MLLRGRQPEAIPNTTGRLLRRATALLAMTMIFTSCAALDSMNATPVEIPATETPIPSPTINWFPASETPTFQALATKTPTPEMRPGLSATLLTDDFSDPSLWDASRASSDQASAIMEDNHLTLAAQSGVYIFRLRHDLILNDHYAEITARPSLCRDKDSYGLLVRASAANYYRFALSCNGTVRMEKLSAGIKLTMQKPLPSGDVPPGAPGKVRIGIWAVGPELRLFLNERYQFSISDRSFPSGTIGVFVSSAGETPMVVSFSELKIQKVDYILPTKTPLP
jgi:hypothetical protein